MLQEAWLLGTIRRLLLPCRGLRRIAGHTFESLLAFGGCKPTILGIMPVAKLDLMLIGEACTCSCHPLQVHLMSAGIALSCLRVLWQTHFNQRHLRTGSSAELQLSSSHPAWTAQGSLLCSGCQTRP